MNLLTAILSFLAPRSPASYPPTAILNNIIKSGTFEVPPKLDEVNATLDLMKKEGYGRLVAVDLEPVSMRPYWRATDTGVKHWMDTGRIMLGE